MQDLARSAASKRANGSLAVSSRGDGWAWICCDDIPFKIVFKSNEQASYLRIHGHIARIDSDVRIPAPGVFACSCKLVCMYMHAHAFG